MIILFLLFIVPARAHEPVLTKAPLFADSTIDDFINKIKITKLIPSPAVDIVFDFYKKNRASVNGLQDSSCINKKEYRIRPQDGRFSKARLKAGIENENCLCIMDYTRPKTDKRGHCIFLAKDTDPVIESFVVAHGSGSNEEKGCPTRFTNALTSTGTTLSGLFLTAGTTYKFQGTAKGVGRYFSTGLSLYGVENSNWTAGNVGKATHGAPYVIDGPKQNVGRSLGCPAMTVDQAQKTLPRCTNKAAWLNYTHATKSKTTLLLDSCK